MTRRNFISLASMAGISAFAAPGGAYRTILHKALIRERLNADVAAALLGAGFNGVELSGKTVTRAEAKAARRIAEDRGIAIHSFMGGWFEFNAKDAAARRSAIDGAKRNIEITRDYGASVMLVVPGKVGGIEMPRPSQFELEFDAASLELKRAAANGGFAGYIAAQNDATKYAQDALGEIAPFAAEHGVVLGLENVWNNLWVKPDFAAAFVRSFRNPWIKAYLDMGNHVRYAPTEEWLYALSDQIVKLHIKDFKIDRSVPREGSFVRIGDGSVNWKSVRAAIDRIGYNGWVSIEADGWTDAEHSAIMDRFFRGEL